MATIKKGGIMEQKFDNLITEMNNPCTTTLDRCTTLEMVEILNKEDQKVAVAIAQASREIAQAIDLAAEKLKANGRMIYVGAGSSGGLGVLDASECRATFGVSSETVQAAIDGGNTALWDAMFGDEDNADNGREEMKKRNISEKDIVVGVTASGRTPYVLGAIEQAQLAGAATVGICNNPNTELSRLVDVAICVISGPEPIQGSTRMKSGTAQKLILNMLSTGTMVKLGKVYRNLMVDVNPINEKLIDRAHRIVIQATGAEPEYARKILQECNNHAKKAIVCILHSCSPQQADARLIENNGFIDDAV